MLEVQQEVCNCVAQNLIVLFHRPHTILKSLRDYKGKDHKWIGGQIESSDGPLMYKVKTDLGSTWRRHAVYGSSRDIVPLEQL
jgi:hypothetical protein